MPTLNIKDPEVYRLAAELAVRRGTSMTAAVRAALADALRAVEADRTQRLERLLEISRRSGKQIRRDHIVFLTDDDLYDEQGLPR